MTAIVPIHEGKLNLLALELRKISGVPVSTLRRYLDQAYALNRPEVEAVSRPSRNAGLVQRARSGEFDVIECGGCAPPVYVGQRDPGDENPEPPGAA